MTALSPVAAHGAVLERAALAGVEVSCSRFEEWAPAEPFDCLLFAESLNPFPLHADFFAHCRSFLRPGGHLLMADELSPERRAQLESAAGFQLVRSADISHNVAPTLQWWAGQQKTFAAAVAALSATLSLHDPAVAGQVREILGGLPEGELKALFSGEATSPGSLGRYMIYLLQAS